MSICLKIFQNKMSVELPWSIRVFLMMELTISILIAIGLSVPVNWLEVICCEGYGQHVRYSVPRDHIDGPNLPKVSLSFEGSGPTPSEAYGYGFYDSPRLVERSLFSRLLHLADQLVCFQSLPWPGSSLFLPSGLYECGWWTNSFRWPSIMSSFILSFKALHSSIEWPRLRWHR